MKETETQDITVEEVARKLQEHRSEILEQFSTAYLAESGLLPSQVELVHESKIEEGVITDTFYFRRKDSASKKPS